MLGFISSNVLAPQKYRIFTRFKGTLGPLNCLSLTRDGKLLASGADDQALRIWDIHGKRHLQTLEDNSGRWGQITCLKWLTMNAGEGSILCFGTGRGVLLIYQAGKELENFREMSSTNVFAIDDPVESVDFDRGKCRLAISSHNGKIRMYSVDKSGSLLSIWEKCMPAPDVGVRCATPRSVRFTEKGEQLLVFSLEPGVMDSKIAATGAEGWSKTLSSSIGNACLSSGENLLLVDNLVDGFDLYKYPHNSPFRSLYFPREKSYVLGGVFVENGICVACGSDHGDVYLFSIEKGESIQTLRHGSRHTMIQALDAVSTNDCHFIASGNSDKRPDIIIWRKIIKNSQTTSGAYVIRVNITTILMVCNLLIIVGLALAIGLDGKQKEAIATIMQFRGLSKRRAVHSAATYDYTLKERARQAMESSKALLLKKGIDIDDPESLKTYFENVAA